jgi:Ser/Thr protein kinase RdoA (MazF antagonist)
MHTHEVTPQQIAADEAVVRHELELSGGDQIELEEEGWDSRVYLVNRGEVVFKFPRSPRVSEQYEYESAVLTMLEQHELPARTPRVRWVGANYSFLGYEGIPGAALDDVLPGLDRSRQAAIGATIGRFVKTLHQLTLDVARRITLDEEVRIYHEKFGLAEPVLHTQLTQDEFKAARHFFFEVLPSELRRLGRDPKLCHGDLGPWNVVVTPDNEIGIIDFGDLGYWDASKDLSGRDQGLLAAARDAYGADENLRAKATVRDKAFPVLDMPFYMGKNDPAGVEMCLAETRRLIVHG